MPRVDDAAATPSPMQPSLSPASLIIATRNRPDRLKAAAASILAGEDVPAELIIVDQSDARHPRLSCLRTARLCGIRYLRTRSVGLSRANNRGVVAARHDLLVFTHDDVLAPPGWFGAIVRALSRSRRAPHLAAGDAPYATGVIFGALEWLLTHRMLRSRSADRF